MHDITIRDLNLKRFVQSYSTFAYLLCEHIHNINMHMYITSARGHELSGCVRADT